MCSCVPSRPWTHESFLREIFYFTVSREFSPSKVSRYTVSSSTASTENCLYNIILNAICRRYNSLNQLSCIVCGVPIKSEILWSSHIQSRKHKDAVLLLKNKQTTSAGISQQSVEKRETFLKPSAPPAGKRKHVEV